MTNMTGLLIYRLAASAGQISQVTLQMLLAVINCS